MKETVVIIQEWSILAAQGQTGPMPTLNKVCRVELSGFGDSLRQWEEGLTQLKEQMKLEKIRLILPNTICSTKILQIPSVKGKRLQDLVDREMQDGLKGDIKDYSVITSDAKKGMSICCGSLEPAMMKQIADMLQRIGVTVKSITVPMENYLRVLTKVKKYDKQTAIYLFFDAGGVTSILSQNGVYLYSSRSRLFSEPGTFDFGTEIVRNISGIMQFYAASKNEIPITDVYYAGCSQENFEVSIDGIHNMNLEVHHMQLSKKTVIAGKQDPSEWMPCIGALICNDRKMRDMNLLKHIKEEEAAGSGAKFTVRDFTLPFVCALVCMAATVGVKTLTAMEEKQTKEIDDWIHSERVYVPYEEAVELENRVGALHAAIDAVEQMKEHLDTYPRYSTDFMKKLTQVGGNDVTVTVSSFNSSKGEIAFRVQSDKVIDIPEYILKLEKTGLFYEVNYTGYQYIGDSYQLSLSCLLAANETKGGNEQ